MALGLELPPLLLTIPVALTATCAFMLAGGNPAERHRPRFGVRHHRQMVRGGVLLNLLGVVLITLATTTLAVAVFSLAYWLPPSPARGSAR